MIFAAVVLNGTIGFIQESRARKAITSLAEMSAPKAHLLRGGEKGGRRDAFVGTLVGGATITGFLLADRSYDRIAVARTVAVITLVFGQICYLLSARFLREPSYLPSRLLANPIAWGASAY